MNTKRIAQILAGAAIGTLLLATGAEAKKGAPAASSCTAADSRIAFSWLDAARTIYTVNPDGSCLVQLTSGGQSVPMSWTADNYLLTKEALLSVPDSTDPAAVSTVYSYGREFEDISQHRDASGVLPATQQLLLATAADGYNIEVCTANGATCTQLTNYVNTYDGQRWDRAPRPSRALAAAKSRPRPHSDRLSLRLGRASGRRGRLTTRLASAFSA